MGRRQKKVKLKCYSYAYFTDQCFEVSRVTYKTGSIEGFCLETVRKDENCQDRL